MQNITVDIKKKSIGISSNLVAIGKGGMNPGVYDPNEIKADVFNMDNMVDGEEKHYVTDEQIETWNGKQDALTAGENITIDENNVIRATDTTYTAGDNISIDNNVISAVDTTYTAGEGISIDENNVISNTQTSAEWGNIQGDIADQTDLQQALGDKQDVLTAGENIDITNNVISATDTTYEACDFDIKDLADSCSCKQKWDNKQNTLTAGDNIDITNNVISATDTTYQSCDFDIKDLSDVCGCKQEWSGKQDTLIAGDNIDITNNVISACGVTPNDATLTIQKNSCCIGTFTANASEDKTINITVPVTAADVNALPDSTKYGASVTMSIDSSTYVVTLTLKDQDGNTLGSAQTIDLPIESVVVSGSYDADTKEVVLVLKNGSEIRFSVADLVSGLQTEITVDNKLDADLVDDSTSTNKFVTAADKCNWDAKADICDIPTDNCQLANGCGYTTCTGTLVPSDLCDYAKCCDIPIDNCQLGNGCGYTTCTGTLVANDIANLAQCCDIPTDNNQLANGCGYIKNGDCASLCYLIIDKGCGCCTQLNPNNIRVTCGLCGTVMYQDSFAILDYDEYTGMCYTMCSIEGDYGYFLFDKSCEEGIAQMCDLPDTSCLAQCCDIPTDNCQLANSCGYTTCTGTLVASDIQNLAQCCDIPTDNCQLANGCGYITCSDLPDLSGYQLKCNMVCNLTNADNDHYPTAKAVSDAMACAGVGDMLSSVYDPCGCCADAFDYCNLYNTPTIPTDNCELANSCGFTTCTGTLVQSDIQDLAQCCDIPTDNCQLANGCGYIKGINCSDVTTALGYTPYNSTNPAGYTTCTGTLVQSDIQNLAQCCDIPTDNCQLTNGCGYTTCTGDMQYSQFNFTTLTGNTVTLDLSSTITPTANFTVNAPSTIKDGQMYVLRVNNGATAYTMTLGTNILNPSSVSTTLTANTTDQFVFLAVGGRLELQDTALSGSTKYGASFELSLNSSTYVVTATLKDQDGNTLGSSQTIDLPLESVVVGGSYDDETKKVILTLQNGNTVEFSVADLVSGLQSEITSDNKLDADLVDDSTSTNKFVTSTDICNWNAKADICDIPTDNCQLGNGCGYTTCTGTLVASDIACLAQCCDIPTDNCQLANGCGYTTCTGTLVASDIACLAQCCDIPTNNCQLANGCGYITGINCSDVTSALGYTPYNSTNPAGYTSCIGTITELDVASTLRLGLVKLGDDTRLDSGNVQRPSDARERTYVVQNIAKSEQMAVNVPWTDTTYTSSDFDIKDLTDSCSCRNTWNCKQDALTAGNGIDITNNVVSGKTMYIITEDMMTKSTTATKGVEPYNTDYYYTNITIDDTKGIKWEEGALYMFMWDSMTASSSYRNVRMRIGTSGDWKPFMSVGGTILNGNTFVAKGYVRPYMYTTRYQSGGAVQANYDANTTYTSITQSEINTGTCTTGRIISAANLKYAVQHYDTCYCAGNGLCLDACNCFSVDNSVVALQCDIPTDNCDLSNGCGYTTCTGDMQYCDFNFATLSGASITLGLSSTITPSANFTVNAPSTIQDGQIYVLRVSSGATAYTMTLGTNVTNPSSVDLTLTANTTDQFVFLGVGGKLELQKEGGSDSSITKASSAPSNPSNGDIWYNTYNFTYYTYGEGEWFPLSDTEWTDHYSYNSQPATITLNHLYVNHDIILLGDGTTVTEIDYDEEPLMGGTHYFNVVNASTSNDALISIFGVQLVILKDNGEYAENHFAFTYNTIDGKFQIASGTMNLLSQDQYDGFTSDKETDGVFRWILEDE